MEFYLYNKDDRKSSTLVNLGTTFKLNDVNYIVYYNTEVEKSSIDIYIGKISYGDQCLVINKIDSDKQNDFLTVVKSILAGNNPETEASDYENIIDTATIVLESVQKIQVPTASLDFLRNYHKNPVEVAKEQDSVEDNKEDKQENKNNVVSDSLAVNNSKSFNENKDIKIEEKKEVGKIEGNPVTNNSTTNNTMVFNDKLGNLDSVLNEKDTPKEKKPKKMISTPILVLLIIAVIGAAILYFVGNSME
ncbi:MAG: hypothetical protein HFI87_06180 [Bacilli bacterium]|nr:hypothetical protein [Bacilli bacterium]